MPVHVMTHRGVEIPASVAATVTASNESPEALIGRLREAGRHRIHVDGGATIRSFLEADLIDDLTLTTIPVILGRGRPLFGAVLPEVVLALESVRSFPLGLVQTRYRVQRDDPQSTLHTPQTDLAKS
jgi:dihydrofolate reductase